MFQKFSKQTRPHRVARLAILWPKFGNLATFQSVWPPKIEFGHFEKLATFENLATFWPFFILSAQNKNNFVHFPKFGHFLPYFKIIR